MRPSTLLLASLVALAVAAPASASSRNGRIVYEQFGGTVGKCPEPRQTPECETDARLYSVRATGGNRHRIGTCSIEFGRDVQSRLCGGEDPAWSPAGRRLAFTALEGRDSPLISIIDLKGAERARVYATPGGDDGEAAQPTWSPHGARIAFTASEPGSNSIRAARNDGSRLTQITAGPFDSHPAWSVRGVIAFERAPSFEDSEGDIYAVRRAGGPARRLTFSGGQDPDWSPDGLRLAFARLTDGASDVYVVRADGSHPRRLTTDGDSGEPAWSPDGRWIAYTSHDSIYRVRAGGRGRRLVARPSGADSLLSPDWRPLPRKKRR